MSRRLQTLLFIASFFLALGAQANSEEKKEGEGAATSSSEYLDIKPALITNYGGPGPIHFIKVEIALRVGKDPEAGLKVAHHMPHIRHELVMLFSRQTEDSIGTMEGKEQLRKDALAAVQKVVQEEEGKPIVEDLLFNNFIVQR
ncbi:MAG: flagellar basal body-associated protein FliL-like protein [Verrucomicrobiaceae bacterium]|nr:flagellar basal body-associated protein FliL-like protein [Verrucomicrobiaceae bacterium]